MWGDEDDPHTPETPPAPKAKKIVPNAAAEFVPAKTKSDPDPLPDGQARTQDAPRGAKLTHNDPTGKKRQRIN